MHNFAFRLQKELLCLGVCHSLEEAFRSDHCLLSLGGGQRPPSGEGLILGLGVFNVLLHAGVGFFDSDGWLWTGYFNICGSHSTLPLTE